MDQPTKSIFASDSLNFKNRDSRTLENDPDHSRLSQHGYYWSVPLDVLSWSCVRTWREERTRAAEVRADLEDGYGLGATSNGLIGRFSPLPNPRGRKKDVLSPFACAIFLRRERGRSGEWRSYLPGRTGDTATLIRAPCNGKPMNFSSPLATLSFWHACAPLSLSSSLLSLPRRAIRQPADSPLSPRSPRRDWRVHPYFRYAFVPAPQKTGCSDTRIPPLPCFILLNSRQTRG